MAERRGTSLAGYIGVGVALVAMLLGGLYIVRNQSTQNSSPETTNQQPNKPQEDNKNQEQAQSNTQDDKAGDTAAQNGSRATTDATPRAGAGNSGPVALPTTGTEDIITGVAGSVLVLLTVAYYAKSRLRMRSALERF